ncbi:PadR family transcriptional regulator [Erwinia psidii]|uniref:PadR family transcriptional regulator n=1 Tax=Erwinia psidii TaxID=69224 RepID=A0A3N6SIS9_9GAMM|nr:PadR family transcriptional regulator [Erwinia psidii]MCX8955975.1 PadR family transcriptional regulator [Erwinia psidii]MCX8961347.1 PadR family transcriptional regulator [Erwinia psidii]MCX8963807.1 PadR family transcriptional regulator [Erwinia psidii]RQM38681.1 PadR family transcriptional regulator [Erwinia psidii]
MKHHQNMQGASCLHRKRRGKRLDAGDIRLLILHFVSQGAAHGYELIKSVEDLSKGEYTPSPGIIYPALSLLEELEYIRSSDALAGRKTFCLTAEGQRHLRENHSGLQNIISRLSSLAILAENRSQPEVERAIHNMKTALNTRLSRPGLAEETLYTIIDALDEAAKKIERS